MVKWLLDGQKSQLKVPTKPILLMSYRYYKLQSNSSRVEKASFFMKFGPRIRPRSRLISHM